jgi:hypothetical protein
VSVTSSGFQFGDAPARVGEFVFETGDAVGGVEGEAFVE